MPPVMATATGFTRLPGVGLGGLGGRFGLRSGLVGDLGLGDGRLGEILVDNFGVAFGCVLARLGDNVRLVAGVNLVVELVELGCGRRSRVVVGELDVAGEVRSLLLRDRATALDPLQREREPATLAVDLEDQDLDVVALRDDLARVLDVVVRELGDVHEPFDAGKDLDEGAERDDLRDLPVDDVALGVGVDHLLPRVRLRLLEAERDPLAVAVDVEHLDLDGLADLEHLARVVDVRPRELGDVDQAVHPVEVDERAEVDDVGDLPLDDVARVQVVEDLLALLLALLFEHGAPGKDDVVARAVELDDLGHELLAHELVEILHAADVDERRRQKAADAQVEDEPALDDLDHLAGDRLAGLGRRLDALPRKLEAGALLREDQPTLRVLLREDERVDLLAHRHLVGRIDRAADRELVDRDDAL